MLSIFEYIAEIDRSTDRQIDIFRMSAFRTLGVRSVHTSDTAHVRNHRHNKLTDLDMRWPTRHVIH